MLPPGQIHTFFLLYSPKQEMSSPGSGLKKDSAEVRGYFCTAFGCYQCGIRFYLRVSEIIGRKVKHTRMNRSLLLGTHKTITKMPGGRNAPSGKSK